MRKRLLLFICFVGMASIAFAEGPVVEFEGRYWITDLDADAKVVESGLGTEFDLKSDLGIDDENYPEGRFTWHTGPNSKIRFAYTRVDYEGDQTLSRTIDFNGKSYTVGARVVSDFEIQYFRLGWIWQFLNIEDKLKLGPMVDLKGIMADLSLNAPTLSINESEEFLGGLPTIGAALDFNVVEDLDILGNVSLFGEISGIPAGDLGHFFDAEAGIKIMPCKYFSITGGYRVIDFEVEDDPDFASLTITGPFVAASLSF